MSTGTITGSRSVSPPHCDTDFAATTQIVRVVGHDLRAVLGDDLTASSTGSPPAPTAAASVNVIRASAAAAATSAPTVPVGEAQKDVGNGEAVRSYASSQLTKLNTREREILRLVATVVQQLGVGVQRCRDVRVAELPRDEGDVDARGNNGNTQRSFALARAFGLAPTASTGY